MKRPLVSSMALWPLVGAANLYSLQTKDVGSSYASSIFYDDQFDRLFVTGGTYGHYFDSQTPNSKPPRKESDCFLGILQLPDGEARTDPQWIRRVTYSTPDVSDACSSLFVSGRGESQRIFLLGHADESAGQLIPHGGRNATVYGNILQVDWKGEAVGGFLVDDEAVNYPISIDGDGEDLFVSSLHSTFAESDAPYLSWEMLEGDIQLDTTTAGGYLPPQYGKDFTVTIKRLSHMTAYEDADPTSETTSDINSTEVTGDPAADQDESGWLAHLNGTDVATLADPREEFSIYSVSLTGGTATVPTTLFQRWSKTLQSNSTIQITSTQYISEHRLVIAGSTKGIGGFFGGRVNQTESLDGFVTVLHPRSRFVENSRRIASDGRDRILGLCHHGETDLYIVGMTDGQLPETASFHGTPRPGYYQAFVQKLDAGTLEVVWSFQLGAINDYDAPQVHGLSCSVTPDGREVYVTGNVKDGSVLSLDGKSPLGTSRSQGFDDVFIAQLEAENGTLLFAHQLGSHEDDRVPSGDAVQCDKLGNAILVVNTDGNFVREKTPYEYGVVRDIAVLFVDRVDGTHKELLAESTLSPPSVFSGTNVANPDLPTESMPPVDQLPGLRPEDMIDQRPNPPVDSGAQPMSSTNRTGYIVAMILLGNVAAIGVSVLICARRQKRREETIVARYLRQLEEGNQGPQDPLCFVDSHSLRKVDKDIAQRRSLERRGDSVSIAESMGFLSGRTLLSRPPEKLSGQRDGLLKLEPIPTSPNTRRSCDPPSFLDDEVELSTNGKEDKTDDCPSTAHSDSDGSLI